MAPSALPTLLLKGNNMNSDDDEKEMNDGDYRRDFSKLEGTVEIVVHQTLAFFLVFIFFSTHHCHLSLSILYSLLLYTIVHSVSSILFLPLQFGFLFKLSKIYKI